jgi:hypothetical protein
MIELGFEKIAKHEKSEDIKLRPEESEVEKQQHTVTGKSNGTTVDSQSANLVYGRRGFYIYKRSRCPSKRTSR